MVAASITAEANAFTVLGLGFRVPDESPLCIDQPTCLPLCLFSYLSIYLTIYSYLDKDIETDTDTQTYVVPRPSGRLLEEPQSQTPKP